MYYYIREKKNAEDNSKLITSSDMAITYDEEEEVCNLSPKATTSRYEISEIPKEGEKEDVSTITPESKASLEVHEERVINYVRITLETLIE